MLLTTALQMGLDPSLPAIGRTCDMTGQTLRNMCEGKPCRGFTIRRLCRALNIDPHDLQQAIEAGRQQKR